MEITTSWTFFVSYKKPIKVNPKLKKLTSVDSKLKPTKVYSGPSPLPPHSE
jgi:hypothetical protein